MNQIQPKHFCILAIAPSTRGFGFAVLEGQETLVDWGVKTVQGDKNGQSLAKVKKLIAHYQPGTLVLEDASAKNSRRSPRIRTLAQQIVKMAATLKMTAKLFSRDQVMKTLIADGQGTKHLLAEIIAKRFPEQLGLQVPPKRKPWMSEDSRMGVFDAVALAMVFRQKYVKTVGRRRNWVQPVAALSAVGRHGRNARGVAEGAWGQAESQRVESRTIHLRSRVSGGGKEWRGKLGR